MGEIIGANTGDSTAQILAAAIGASAALAAVSFTVWQTRRLESAKRREELVSAAVSDFMKSVAEKVFPAPDDPQTLATYAKARLILYGDALLSKEILRYERGGPPGSSSESISAIVAVAQNIRSANKAAGRLTDQEITALLFGEPNHGERSTR
jgi:hypothetical protein